MGLGLATWQRGPSVAFTTGIAPVNGLMAARDDRRLLRLRPQMSGPGNLIIDEPGSVPLSKTGADLLFRAVSRRNEYRPR